MAERRTITDLEKAQEVLRVLQGRIDRLGAKQDEAIALAKELGEQQMPLLARMEYLLQDPVLDDETRKLYRTDEYNEASEDG